MKFHSYSRGSIFAMREPGGNIVLGTKHQGGLLRVQGVVIERADIMDVAVIFECIAGDLDREACGRRGVTVQGDG